MGAVVKDEHSVRSGAEVLAEMLEGYGVSHVFMVPAILRRTMAELELRTSICRIHAHGEKAAAYMADGYARASRRPGVCGAQIIGAMNLAAGLREPWLAHSPVIALTGGRDPLTKFRGVYQEVDDVPAFEPVTKSNATVDDVSRIPDMLRQAFRVATTGCPGPVHLQFQGNEGQLDRQRAEIEPLVEPQFSSVPPFRPATDEQTLRRALDEVEASKRPVIIAGGGVQASGASRELVALAEALNIPVATSLNGKDVIPGDHSLSVGVVGTYSRPTANEVVRAADFVLFVGTGTGGMTTHRWTTPRIGIPAIQIDIEPQSLGRNYPLRVAIQSDARVALKEMLRLLVRSAAPDRAEWLRQVRSICTAWRSDNERLLRSDDDPTRPERICRELTAVVPDDAIVVVDTGHAGMWMGGFFDLRSSSQRYLRSCGHLGWAFPAGLGAKCAKPGRPTVVFTGDAGLWYHIGELETAVRWNIAAVTVVNNNSGGNQSKRGFEDAYGADISERSRELWTYTNVDFAQVAERIGALGIRVDKPGLVRPALERALESGRPAIVDIRTDTDVIAPATL